MYSCLVVSNINKHHCAIKIEPIRDGFGNNLLIKKFKEEIVKNAISIQNEN